MANGVVTSCRCHLANGSEADPWRMVGSDDDDDFPSVNSVLVENENCDTKVKIVLIQGKYYLFTKILRIKD